MSNTDRRKTAATAIATATAGAMTLMFAAALLPAMAQTSAYRAPRTPDGKPNLNGIWQVLNEANYDIQMHMARPALAVRPGPYGPVPAPSVLALGAAGAVPPGMGVVEGNEIPYKPEALARKRARRFCNTAPAPSNAC